MKDRRREQLLSKALQLFATRGLSGTKISHIANAAGISQGLLYHYYKSKEDIYTELIGGALERMNEAARGLEKLPISPREKISHALEAMLDNMQHNDDFSRYFMLIAQATASEDIPPATRQIIEKENRTPYEVIERIMIAGQQDGSIKQHDASELALVFWTTIKGLAFHATTHKATFRAPDVRLLTSLFFTESD